MLAKTGGDRAAPCAKLGARRLGAPTHRHRMHLGVACSGPQRAVCERKIDRRGLLLLRLAFSQRRKLPAQQIALRLTRSAAVVPRVDAALGGSRSSRRLRVQQQPQGTVWAAPPLRRVGQGEGCHCGRCYAAADGSRADRLLEWPPGRSRPTASAAQQQGAGTAAAAAREICVARRSGSSAAANPGACPNAGSSRQRRCKRLELPPHAAAGPIAACSPLGLRCKLASRQGPAQRKGAARQAARRHAAVACGPARPHLPSSLAPAKHLRAQNELL